MSYSTNELNKLWKSIQRYNLVGSPEPMNAYEYKRSKIGCPCPHCGTIMERPFSKFEISEAKERGINLENPNMVSIDHIFPKSKYPQFMMFYDNLEVICSQCNSDKGRDETSYHGPSELHELYNKLVTLYVRLEEERYAEQKPKVEITEEITTTTRRKFKLY